MRPLLGERHAPLFAALSPEQVERVWRKVRPVLAPNCSCDNPTDGPALMRTCASHHLDHAGVILCLAGEYDAVGRGALEALVGHPIVPWQASLEAAQNAPHKAVQAGPARPASRVAAPRPALAQHPALPAPLKALRGRVVGAVVPNPRRPGTAVYEQYKGWREGDTVAQCLDSGAGLTSGSLAKALAHGWITLVPEKTDGEG